MVEKLNIAVIKSFLFTPCKMMAANQAQDKVVIYIDMFFQIFQRSQWSTRLLSNVSDGTSSLTSYHCKVLI